MTPESDKPIEKLLHASARARRAEFGTDPAMPNPMRARLHGEIDSLNRVAEQPARRFIFSWPRFALAATAAALLISLSMLWWRQTSPTRTTSAAPDQTAAKPSEAADNAFAESRDRPEPPLGLARKDTAKEAAPAAAVPAAAARNVGQQFAQSSAQGNSNKLKSFNALNTFRFEQDGETVRLIDADGSTYTGKVERPAEDEAPTSTNQSARESGRLLAKARPAKEMKDKNEATNEYYFRASGYNNQLKRSLSLEASYVAAPSPANENQDRKSTQSNRQARIIGTARIEGEAPVQVDAAAVPP